jgi:uncharacterized protein involved in outer membrane biogenesis
MKPPVADSHATPALRRPGAPRLRRFIFVVVGVLAVYGLLVGVALPPLARKVMAEKLGETLGRTIAIDDLIINPFTLAAEVKGLRILEPDARTAFVSFDRLDLDADASSLYRLAPVVDELTLSGLKVSVVRDGEEHFNFSDILARLAQASARKRQPAGDDDEARFSFSNIRVVNASIDFDDRPKGRRHQVTEVQVAIPFVSNLPVHLKQYVHPAFSAKVNGAPLALAGETLPFEDSLRTRFTLELDALDIRHYLGYAPAPLPARIDSGTLDARISVRFTQATGKQPSVDISGATALRDVAVSTADGPLARFAALQADIASFDPLAGKAQVTSIALRGAHALADKVSIPGLEARQISLDLKKRQARIESMTASGGAVSVKRNPDRTVDLPKLMPAQPAEGKPAQPEGAPWDVVVAKAAIGDYQVTLIDDAVKPATTHRVAIASLEAEELTTRDGLKGRATGRLGFGKGTLELASTFALDPLAVSATVDARRIDLVPLRVYVPGFATVTLGSGVASAKGTVTLRGKGDAMHVGYRGVAEIANLAATEGRAREPLLNWKSVRTGGIELDMPPSAPLSLAVAEVVVEKIYSRVVLDADGKLNLQRLRTATPEQPVGAPAPEPQPRNVRIDRVSFVDGRLDFTDLFIRPNYSADVGELQGTVTGLSSRPESRAAVDLKGRYDRTSPVVIAGSVNPLRGDLFLDIAAKGSDIELPKLTAYSQRYAGYGITEGKLTLDVKYLIDGGKLEGRNKIFVDQLTFGEKVEGPEATKLPVLFAVNLLKDAKGQINLELPVSGSLADPQFEISGLVTQVLGGLLKRAVTSPFSLLAAALGGGGASAAGGAGPSGGDDLAFVEFSPGRADLDATDRKKLDALVKALLDRPALKLEISARVDAQRDREALRKAELQRRLVEMKRAELAAAGKAAKPDEPVETEAADHPRYVRALFEREKLAQSRTEPAPKVASIAGALPAPQGPTAPAAAPPAEMTVAAMEAALLESIEIGEDQLQALASRRGTQARDYLVAAGRLPGERVIIATAPAPPAESSKSLPSRVDFALR